MRDAAVKARNGGTHRSANVRWWQAVSAVVPITLVAGAWGIAVTASPGSDTIDAKMDETPPQPGTPAITDVPTDAFEQPRAGQVKKNQSGHHPLAEVQKSQTKPASLKSTPLPTPALDAYRDAEKVMADVKGPCKLDWTLVAAIGRVESDHGQYAGSTVDTSGISSPKIIGIPLDGTNETAAIRDTDDGQYDGDTTWDRAVGPMQFIPSTWDLVGVDGNGDGKKDPNNIYDAALATSVYLCADGEDVSTRDGASEAVFSYNHSTDYVANVLAIAEAYRHGDFSESPGVVPETNIVPEGDVFDPSTVDEDGGHSPKHRLKPTEFGPAHSESGGSDRLQPMHKSTKKNGHGDDKGDHKQHQVGPATSDGPGKGEGLIEQQNIGSVPRNKAKPADPKGNNKPDNTDGFVDHSTANDNQGTGQGKIQQQDVGPTKDKAPDEPRHKAKDNQDSDVPSGPGVDVRPKHRADVDPAGPRQDAKPAAPKQDAKPAAPKQDAKPAAPKQDAKPAAPKQDAKPAAPKQDAKPAAPKQDAKPAAPKQDAKPAAPKQDAKPAAPKQDAKPAAPKQDAKPAAPKQDAKPAAPKQDAKPAAPKQDAKPAAPKQDAKPAAPKQDAKPAAPKQDAKPAAPKQDAKPAAPKQDAKPAAPKQDAKPAAPEQTAPAQPKQDKPTVRPQRRAKAHSGATKTAPAATTYAPADTLVEEFLASYSLFWSLPSEGSSSL